MICDSTLEFLRSCHLPTVELSQLDRLERLRLELMLANRQLNLTRLTSPADYWVKHICDSLSIARCCPEIISARWQVADVGCGAGFPLLPLAWANTAATFVGIEAKRKKTDFIAAAAAKLDFDNVEIIHATAREAAYLPQYQARFDAVLLRAVGRPEKLIKDCRLLLKPDAALGIVFYMTPNSVQENLAAAARESKKCGLRISASRPLELPGNAGSRQFLIARQRL